MRTPRRIRAKTFEASEIDAQAIIGSAYKSELDETVAEVGWE